MNELEFLTRNLDESGDLHPYEERQPEYSSRK